MKTYKKQRTLRMRRAGTLLAALVCGLAIQPALAQDDFDLDDLFGGSAAESPQPEPQTAAPTPTPTPVAVISLPKPKRPPLEPEHIDRATALEEIVVTARKREESIQEVPLSVTPFTAGELEQRGFTGLDDIAAATPGFTFEGFMTGGAHGNAVIRGLAQQFTTSRIQNVSFFLDGVYLMRQSMLNLGMVDMERIEVVKGPQNALYGRNAFGGAVNYITLRPGSAPEGYAMTTVGDNDRAEYRFGISGPLDDSQTLFGKVTGGVSMYDGHTVNDHPVANANPIGPNLRGNLGGSNDSTYSVSVAYDPLETMRFRASYYRSEMQRETQPGYSISGVGAARFGLRFDDQNDLNCNTATVDDISPYPPRTHTGFTAYCGELPRYASDVAERTMDGIIVDPRAIGTIAKTDAITFTADYDFSENLSGYYLFGLAKHNSYTDGGASDEDPLAGRSLATNAVITSVDNQQREGYSFGNTASSRPNTELESFSHELRFDWQFAPRLRSSFGVYYSQVKDEEWTALFINNLCNADTEENIEHCNQPLSYPNSFADETVLTVAVAYDQYTRQHGGRNRGEWTAFKDTISAAFLSLSFDFTDSLEGTVEARYTQEKKWVRRFTDSMMVPFGETITYNPPADPVLPFANTLESTIVVPEDEETFPYFTPRAILNWSWSDMNMVYASVAKGVKAGGFNNADDPSELTYAPAENWTYEIGSKNSFFHRAITLNGAVYFIDWTGLQGGVPPTTGGLSTSDIITNIGGATSVGVEAEASAVLPYGFSLDAGFTINDASYDDDVIYSAGIQETGRFHCDGVTCPADGSVGGNQLARTSAEQYSFGINYRRDIAGWLMNARVDTSYQSKQYVTPLNLAWAPERQLVNASMNFSSPRERFDIGFWGKNLTDEDYASNAFFIGVFNQYMVGKGAGLTYGATLKYNFN